MIGMLEIYIFMFYKNILIISKVQPSIPSVDYIKLSSTETQGADVCRWRQQLQDNNLRIFLFCFARKQIGKRLYVK